MKQPNKKSAAQKAGLGIKTIVMGVKVNGETE